MEPFDVVKKYCDDYRDSLSRYVEKKPTPFGKKRSRIISMSDLHAPFLREDLVKEITRKHSGSEYLVLNGDIFDCNLISSFPKNKEIPFALEYSVVFKLVEFLSSHFGSLVLVDGNHDAGRFATEIGKLNPTIKFLVKTSPLQYIAEGHKFSAHGQKLGVVNFPNVIYAGESGGGWYTKIGKAIFGHRTKGFKSNPMQNACLMTKWFIEQGEDFQCLVAGHSHKVGSAAYLGKIVIDQGALCMPMAYEKDGRCTMSPPDLGYAIVDIDAKGNVDPETTRPVYLGTYQKRNYEEL